MAFMFLRDPYKNNTFSDDFYVHGDTFYVHRDTFDDFDYYVDHDIIDWGY